MRKIYIDLDGLLDTRLGTLSLLNTEAAVQVIQTDAYWDREFDDWNQLTNGFVDNTAFEKAWGERDHRVLRESVVTSIMVVLNRVITEYHRNVKDGVVDDDVAIEINVAPYEFTDEEMEELTDIIRSATYSELPVMFLSRAVEDLTPSFIRERYAAMVFFEFHRWIRLHHKELATTPCRDITFIVPRLFEQNPHRLSDEQKRDELIAFRLGLLDYLELEFIDASWFSMFRPRKAHE
jgi:hypothetical protein